jgi:membrane protein implicated in regulation of membrane protease activity
VIKRALVVMLAFAAPALAQINMPDPSAINGKALPAGDLQTGTITVRVVRESIGNNIVGQQVTVRVNGEMKKAVTDEQGRAEFKGLPAGANGVAEADVKGEQLKSDPFVVPGSGGLRVILVAGIAQAAERQKKEEAEAAAAPPVKGAVVLGGNSRIIFEFPDDLMRVYYMLEIVNNARTRVDIGGPLIIDLPEGAAGASPLDGSTPQATVAGSRITVTGPFASGVTNVQVGFQMPFSSSSLTLEQKLPVPLEQVTVASQKLGGLSFSSPQFSSVGDVKGEDGTTYLLASGPGIAAGGALRMEVTGLPVHSPLPRYVALGLAFTIAVLGIWLALPGASGSREQHKRLIARRDTLFGELAHIEERARAGRATAKDGTRRARMLAELEQIYGELDESPGAAA